MKRNILLLFLANFLLLGAASGQTDSSFTLQECLDYAMQNQANVKNAHLDKEIAESQIRATRAIGYPMINGSVSLVDNPALQRMFFSPTNPFFGGGGGAPFPGVEKSGDVLVAPNLFQLRSAGDANAEVTQLIFDGSYIVGLQAASTFREQAVKILTKTKTETVEQVSKAYYGVLILQESVKAFDINLARLDSSIRQLRISFQTGLVEDIEVKRLEVQYNNLLTDEQNALNMLELGKLQLKLSMGMSLDQPISLSDSLSGMEIKAQPIPAEQFDPTKHIDYSILQTQERLALLDLKRNKFSRLPTLAAFAKGGFIRQDVKFLNLVQNDWFGYGMLGLSLSVPILDLRRHYQIQQARYTTQKAKNGMEAAINGFKLEASAARLTYNNKLQAMQNQKNNVELAQEVVRVSKIKYQEGVGTNLELVNAEADLQNAQINYYRALYDAMVAKIDYEKAKGSLYNEQ